MNLEVSDMTTPETRLQKLTRLICKDDRPKQFCPLFGDQTMLEETRKRAERSISPKQILVPLTRSHRAFYLRELGIRPSQRIVQPEKKGAAPPILYSLLSIEQNDDDAIVAILPCDHHYSDERRLLLLWNTPFDSAAQHPGSVMLLDRRGVRKLTTAGSKSGPPLTAMMSSGSTSGGFAKSHRSL